MTDVHVRIGGAHARRWRTLRSKFQQSGALYLISSQPTRYGEDTKDTGEDTEDTAKIRNRDTGNNELIRRLLIYDKMQKIREDTVSFESFTYQIK